MVHYVGSQLINELNTSPNITVHLLPDIPKAIDSEYTKCFVAHLLTLFIIALPINVLRYVAKVLFQTVALFWVVLAKTEKPSNILLQVIYNA